LLTRKINEDSLKFPFQNYIMYSILSIISNFKNDIEKSKKYFELAEENARAKINTLRNPHKKQIGIVKERIPWLDELVRKNRSNGIFTIHQYNHYGLKIKQFLFVILVSIKQIFINNKKK